MIEPNFNKIKKMAMLLKDELAGNRYKCRIWDMVERALGLSLSSV